MNIVNITDLDELKKAKEEIEKTLIASGEISEEINIYEFIDNYIYTGKNVFCVNNEYVIFNIYKHAGMEYLFVAASDTFLVNALTYTLEPIKYDLSKIVKRSNQYIISHNVMLGNYFIINGNISTIE